MIQNLRKKPYGFLIQPLYIFLSLIITIFLYFFCDKTASLWIIAHYNTNTLFQFFTDISKAVDIIFDGTLLLGIFLLIVSGMRLLKYQGFYYQLALMIYILLIFDYGMAYVIKIFLGRVRPEYFLLHGDFGFKFFQFKSYFLSFPSGHTIDVMVFAGVMMYVYSRYRVFIFTMAQFLVLSRVWFLKHFISDVFFGAFLAFFVIPIELYFLEKISHFRYFYFIKPALEIFKPHFVK